MIGESHGNRITREDHADHPSIGTGRGDASKTIDLKKDPDKNYRNLQ